MRLQETQGSSESISSLGKSVIILHLNGVSDSKMDSVPSFTPEEMSLWDFLAWPGSRRNFGAQKGNLSSVPAVTTPQGSGPYFVSSSPYWSSLTFWLPIYCWIWPCFLSALHRGSLRPSSSMPSPSSLFLPSRQRVPQIYSQQNSSLFYFAVHRAWRSPF